MPVDISVLQMHSYIIKSTIYLWLIFFSLCEMNSVWHLSWMCHNHRIIWRSDTRFVSANTSRLIILLASVNVKYNSATKIQIRTIRVYLYICAYFSSQHVRLSFGIGCYILRYCVDICLIAITRRPITHRTRAAIIKSSYRTFGSIYFYLLVSLSFAYVRCEVQWKDRQWFTRPLPLLTQNQYNLN